IRSGSDNDIRFFAPQQPAICGALEVKHAPHPGRDRLASWGAMDSKQPARYLRTEATMAFPEGRLLASRARQLYLLSPDGWSGLGAARPIEAKSLTEAEAADWCMHQGVDLPALDPAQPEP